MLFMNSSQIPQNTLKLLYTPKSLILLTLYPFKRRLNIFPNRENSSHRRTSSNSRLLIPMFNHIYSYFSSLISPPKGSSITWLLIFPTVLRGLSYPFPHLLILQNSLLYCFPYQHFKNILPKKNAKQNRNSPLNIIFDFFSSLILLF